jgi:hypothetical protein
VIWVVVTLQQRGHLLLVCDLGGGDVAALWTFTVGVLSGWWRCCSSVDIYCCVIWVVVMLQQCGHLLLVCDLGGGDVAAVWTFTVGV